MVNTASAPLFPGATVTGVKTPGPGFLKAIGMLLRVIILYFSVGKLVPSVLVY